MKRILIAALALAPIAAARADTLTPADYTQALSSALQGALAREVETRAEVAHLTDQLAAVTKERDALKAVAAATPSKDAPAAPPK